MRDGTPGEIAGCVVPSGGPARRLPPADRRPMLRERLSEAMKDECQWFTG